MKIILNQVRCRKCNNVIVSKHRHDNRSCKCNAIFIDGGTDYQRMGWGRGEADAVMEDFIDTSLSIYQMSEPKHQNLEEFFEVIRALAEQIEAMKKGENIYEVSHYERRLKGHLADLVNLKHELDYRETSEE
ncbi:DUF7695 domain-containing protein [Savagea serpentis]|uniref:DUF7695 domain-containing protein n=1 Tax=Savagea serpentis TaxID=2785297 RepID=UPI001BC94295|nr:hypothetical protein [Savagea serpentis]